MVIETVILGGMIMTPMGYLRIPCYPFHHWFRLFRISPYPVITFRWLVVCDT